MIYIDTFEQAHEAFFALSHDERQNVIGRVMFHHPDTFLAAIESAAKDRRGATV